MKLFKKAKKGFTLIELVVVIAVIAILSTIAIISFISVTNKAKLSNDQMLVDQVNLALTAEETLNGKRNTVHETLVALQEDGFSPENFKAESKGYQFVYTKDANRLALFKDGKLTYPKNASKSSNADVWLFTDKDGDLKDGYSHYLRGDKLDKPVTVNAGLDVGFNTNIPSVVYTNNNMQNVVIRTNGGTLTVNAPADTVNHYGKADSVNIVSVASASYHEYGTVPFVQISKGRIEIEATGDVNGIHVANVQVVDSEGNISKTANTFTGDVVLTLNGNEVKLTRDTIGTEISDAVLVCAVDESDSAATEYIWLVGDGTIENAKVYVTSTNATPNTSEASTTTTENASAAAIAIANNAVNIGTTENPVYEAQEAGTSAENAEFTVTAFASGSGTENDPFLIETTKQWMNITYVYETKGETVYYKVVADLNFADQEPYVYEYEYEGATYKNRYYCYTDDATQNIHLDLNNHTLSNVDYPLFDLIYHLDIHNGNIGYSGRYGGITDSVSSRAETSLNVHDLVLYGTIDTNYSHFGPVVSYCYGKNTYNCTVTLENIDNKLMITNAATSSYTGGFIGYIQGSKASLIIKNCTFSGSIQGMYVGGFVGGCSAPNGSPVVSEGNKVSGSLLGSTDAKAFGLSTNVTGGSSTVNSIENGVAVLGTATIRTISPDSNLVSTSIGYGEEFVINHTNSNVSYYTATLSFNIDMADGSSGGYPRNIMFTIETTENSSYNTGLFKCYIESASSNDSTADNLVLNQSGVVVWKVDDTYYVYSDAYKLSNNGKAYLYIYGYNADGGLETYINSSYASVR